MADLGELMQSLVDAQNQTNSILGELKSALKAQERTIQGTTAAESAAQAPDKTSPTAEKGSVGKTESQKMAEQRNKAIKGIAIETAGRLADPFEPRGLALIDAAQGLLGSQIGADAASLAFNTAGASEERFIQQQTFQGAAADALNLANQGIKLDPDTAKSLAQGQRAFGELAAENLKVASEAANQVGISGLAQQFGISPEAADAFGKAAGIPIADAIKSAIGMKGDEAPIKSNRQ